MRSDDNIFDIPHGACIIKKTNAVYINISNYRVQGNDPKKSYTSHKKVCIGVACLDEDGKPTRKMFANQNYHKIFKIGLQQDPPEYADCRSLGTYLVVKKICEEYNLISILRNAFNDDEINLIIDLSMFMLVEEKAVFQHYSAWARKHKNFSSKIRSDSYISRFLKDNITYSKIKIFLRHWARSNIGSGNVYFCYDSTNVNSQAEGMFIVQKGYAKDDKSLPQVNTDYVVRQEDGLPLTFSAFPGSIVDVAEASEMIQFIKEIKEEFHITLVSDRGYISDKNIRLMIENGIDFLLLLKSNMTESQLALNKYADKIKNTYSYYIDKYEAYGITIKKLTNFSDNELFLHIIWDQNLEVKHRKTLINILKNTVKKIEKNIEKRVNISKQELKDLSRYFDLDIATSSKTDEKNSKLSNINAKNLFNIISYKINDLKIEKQIKQCGYYILLSSQDISTVESIDAYHKRDCVEKVFQALKSSLGMEKIGVASDDNLHGKSLIWFIASTLHAVLFNKTKILRINEKKLYTLPAIIDELEAIVVDRNLETQKYERRYNLDKKQKEIYKVFNLSIEDIDKLALCM